MRSEFLHWKPCFGKPLSTFLVLGVLAASAITQTWGNYQGDRGHTGFAPVEVDVPNISQLWTWQVGLAIPLQQPSAGGGAVFTCSRDGETGSLYAMDVASGTVTWTQVIKNLDSLSGVALYNGNLYFQTVDNNEKGLLQCYSSSGALNWQSSYTTQWAEHLTPTIDSGGVYINGGSDGGMYAFNASNGALGWFCSQLGYDFNWTPSLDANMAYAYIYGQNLPAGLYAVDRTTGNLAFQLTDPNFVFDAYSPGEVIAVDAGRGFVTNGHRLVAFDLVNEKILWQSNRDFSGQADIVGNTVYATDAGTLSAFNATTGAFLWAWAPPLGNIADNIVVANNVAFVTDLFNTYAIDLTSHQTVWTIAQGGNLAVADGNLYIGGTTGAITAVSLNALQLAFPTSYQLYRGKPVSGSLASILYDDGQVLKVSSGPTLTNREAPIQVILNGTSVLGNPAKMRFHLKSFANEPGLMQSVDLWNYQTSQWVTVSTTSAATTATIVDVPVAGAGQYVDGSGNLRARVSWRALGPTLTYSWSASIDQAVWLEG